ncbi:hypothetical protein STEG23_017317 [Scotinomys teguina]
MSSAVKGRKVLSFAQGDSCEENRMTDNARGSKGVNWDIRYHKIDFQQKIWLILKICLASSRLGLKVCIFLLQDPDQRTGESETAELDVRGNVCAAGSGKVEKRIKEKPTAASVPLSLL